MEKIFFSNNSYFRGVALPPPLSPEEEAILLNELSTNLEAKNTLIERNLRLVIYIAKKYQNTEISIDDLISIGTIGLIKSINTYSIDKNVKLATYASKCIENEILMFLRNNNKHTNVMSLDDTLNTDSDGNELTLRDITPDPNANNLFEICEKNDLISSILTFALNNLLYKETIIIFYSIGGKTQKEIGNSMALSQSYISRLQKNTHSEIRNFLENGKKSLVRNFTFSIDETYCYIGFSKRNFISFKEVFNRFIINKRTDFSFTYKFCRFTDDNYTWIKMPREKDTFIGIAELIKYISSFMTD